LNFESIKWSLTIGVNEGYIDNDGIYDESKMVKLYQDIALKYYRESDIYISAVIVPSHVIYNNEWGCPEGGEFTYTLTGSCNMEFCNDVERYVDVLKHIVFDLKQELKQATALLEIVPANLTYFKD